MENFPRPSKVCTFSPVSTLYWLISPEDDPVAMCFESGENFAVQACTRMLQSHSELTSAEKNQILQFPVVPSSAAVQPIRT